MKIWRKYLIGIALGFLAALVLPFDSLQWTAGLSFITEIVVRIGRYTLMPLLFFSGIMAVYRLRDDRLLVRTSIWTVGAIVISSAVLAFVGFLSIMVIRLPRIPITTERVSEVTSIGIQNLLRATFPYSSFDALNNGEFLLPVFAFSMVIGAGCCIRQSNLKPVLSLLDSTSELFYNISSVFVELFSIGSIFIMCSWTVQFRDVIKSGVFGPLIIMLVINSIIVIGLVYPLIVKITCKNGKPLRVLYASIVPFMLAFFSGDTNLALSAEMRMGKEKLGIRQRTNGFSFPLFSIFAHGGSALVIMISFVAIRRSYSDLRFEFFELLTIAFTAFCLSFLLGSFPVGGTFTALTVLCTIYGRGMETGYLLLKPAAAIIGSFATLIDAATAMFGCYIIAHNTKTIEVHR